jgi:hypothetical protein
MSEPKVRLLRIEAPDENETEYAVEVNGKVRGYVGRMERHHWIAYDGEGNPLAEIDIDTRADAVDVVLHPERVGLPALEA